MCTEYVVSEDKMDNWILNENAGIFIEFTHNIDENSSSDIYVTFY